MPSVAEFRPGAEALAGRTILITGASGGLGEAAVHACAAAGATVVLLGRRVPKLNRLYDALVAQGAPQPAIYPLDLEGANPEHYGALADTLARELGGLDGVLHCAAEFKGLASLENGAPEDLLRALHVNLVAPLLLTRALMPLLRQRDDAAAVFLLDDTARVGKAFWGGYGIAQHGLRGLVSLLHKENEHSSVRIHGLQPESMRTPLRARAYFAEDPGAIPQACEYAPVCVYLLSAQAAALRGQVLAPRI